MLYGEVLTIALSIIICSFIFTPMAKKSSKKTPNQAQDTTVVEEQKPSSTQKKQSSEIDEIFAGKKRNLKLNAEKPEDVTKRRKKTKKNMKKKTKKARRYWRLCRFMLLASSHKRSSFVSQAHVGIKKAHLLQRNL